MPGDHGCFSIHMAAGKEMISLLFLLQDESQSDTEEKQGQD